MRKHLQLTHKPDEIHSWWHLAVNCHYCRDTPKNVGWVERSETQHNVRGALGCAIASPNLPSAC